MFEVSKACVAQWDHGAGDVSTLLPKQQDVPLGSHSQSDAQSTASRLRGKRVAMVAYSQYPQEPRTRRTVYALIAEGMSIDLICLGKKRKAPYEPLDGLDIRWCPIVHRRDSKLAYFYNYAVFTIFCAIILAVRSLKRPYDIVYIHNMPDVLVLSGLFPKAMGSKLVFDIHDPMPELMMTISDRKEDSLAVRILQWIEKWSIERAHLVVTTNIAFKRAFASRSCPREEIGVVMNSPDEQIFPFRRLHSTATPPGVPSKRFVIMYHGSIVKRSGLDLAIDAFAQVRKTIPSAELRVFGRETPFLLEEMERVRKMGLEGQVHYFGGKRLEELVQEIANCDVGIVPNAQNAFTEINMPTRIFEFLTMGKPAIAPDTIGVRDYFSRDSLIFFGPGNAEDLARKIEQVAFNYSDALETVQRGQDVYLEHKWSQEKQTLANLLDRLLGGGKAPLEN